MIDTESLKRAVKHFEFSSRPINAMSSAPASVDDINKLIRNTARLFNTFIEELENNND